MDWEKDREGKQKIRASTSKAANRSTIDGPGKPRTGVHHNGEAELSVAHFMERSVVLATYSYYQWFLACRRQKLNTIKERQAIKKALQFQSNQGSSKGV